MWHHLRKRDLDTTGRLMGGRFASREWKVCEAYELTKSRDTSEGDADSYLVVPKYRYGPGTFGKWRSYEPLEETPDLFLKFARLYQAQDRPEAMLEWARTYGTLGHGQPPWVRGAPQDAKGFWEAVERAAGLLALYEGVLNRDSQSVQRALLKEFPYMGIWWSIYDEPPAPPADHGLMDLESVASQIAEYVEELYDGDYLGYTLKTVAEEVERMVGTLCRPVLVVEDGSHDPSDVTAQWHFKSLLGAMYLQMYWLMAAGSELTRCEYCGRLISLARPSPESRKRRRDKRFCDDACRQAHHRSKKKP